MISSFFFSLNITGNVHCLPIKRHFNSSKSKVYQNHIVFLQRFRCCWISIPHTIIVHSLELILDIFKASKYHGEICVFGKLTPFLKVQFHASLSGEFTSTEVRRLSNSQSFFPLNMAPSFFETFTKEVLLRFSMDFCC